MCHEPSESSEALAGQRRSDRRFIIVFQTEKHHALLDIGDTTQTTDTAVTGTGTQHAFADVPTYTDTL